ncbi:MAG: OmpW family protein [Alphaproteobacteria bacterium]|nr:OmpW family protein [Alphaproteobacteria bacterium]
MKLPYLLGLLLVTAINTSSACATEAGDWVVRARAVGVLPQEDADITGAVTGSSIDIENSLVPEVDISYFITPNIAMELVLATTPHDVSAQNTSSGNLDLGNAWLLPPTLTAQYHFTDFGAWKPYVGAGANYTIFYKEKAAGSSIADIEYDNSFGPALQVGMDYMIDERWMLNIDIKKIWINSDVKINGGAVRADVDINPWLVGVGVGYRF